MSSQAERESFDKARVTSAREWPGHPCPHDENVHAKPNPGTSTTEALMARNPDPPKVLGQLLSCCWFLVGVCGLHRLSVSMLERGVISPALSLIGTFCLSGVFATNARKSLMMTEIAQEKTHFKITCAPKEIIQKHPKPCHVMAPKTL